ncbi:MAG: glycosyl hydrolase [Bacteroidetes bacterium]|nr:glycosyl hydrolase [Bacteroidota bacterium]
MKNLLLSSSILFSSIFFAQTSDPLLTNSPNGMKWRSIGPFRAGRTLAVAGLRGDRNTYYAGAVGGGVWKTIDGGQSWNCISDTTFHSSSVGAIAVAQSNQNILYVGMGEVEMRSNISFGDGVYKSSDAGKSWKHTGLEKSYAIGTIVVHPQNENLVYAACQGKIFGVNKERGVYRSKDGGKTWENILFVNDSTGCVDIKMDPTNPLILYASMWQSRRTPYSLESGGKGDGLYKSMDGGDTWKKISENAGLPTGLDGKIIVSISPTNGNLLFALVENKTNGGVYKSMDGGNHWMQMSTDNNLKQRPWYFSQIFCDPKNANVVYVLNVQSWKSIDGGKTFPQLINNHHGDNHDLWIDPDDAMRMIIGDDGGPEISIDGARNWTEADLPTGQFYHVNLDNDYPYHVYGDQQDNSSIRIAAKTDGYSIGREDWHNVAGGESGYIVPDPSDSHITYGGEYDGNLSSYNDETHQYRDISVYPVAAIGSGSAQKKYRFQWTYPIAFSPHDPHELFVCSQYVHRSFDGGNSWEIISPDLTRHDSTTMKPSGGPITKDNTGAEIYADIFAFAESDAQKGVLWTGSDDGYIYVSKDDGKNWTNVTPASLLPKFSLITIIEPSHFDAGTVYVSATAYKSDDTKPYLLKSTDYGKTWKLITNGIRANDYTRVVREDPMRKGLLYAGTETGVYVSFNDGEKWESLQLNLPNTPVHDIRIQSREHDLVIATHGRGFWILDDLTPFYDAQFLLTKTAVYLFKPDDAMRTEGGSYYYDGMQEGQNAPSGVSITYFLKNKPKKEMKMIFFTANGDTVKSFSNLKNEDGEPIKISKDFYEDKKIPRHQGLPADSGMNHFTWDMRYPDATKLDKPGPMWAGSTIGPVASPGNFSVKFFIGDSLVAQQNFVIKEDPRFKVTQKDLDEQLALLLKINKKLSETHQAINDLRSIRAQINSYSGSIEDTAFASQMRKISKPILDSLQKIEDALVQSKAVAGQDLLNYPIRLNDQLAGIGSAVSSVDAAPTKQSYVAFDDISALIDVQLNALKKIEKEKIPQFNEMAKKKTADAVKVK